MSNTIEQFDFSLVRADIEEYPFHDYVVIHLVGSFPAPNGFPEISLKLSNAVEIDAHINTLKKDLDTVGANAKRALNRAKN